jgi:hypothetical protein
MTTLANIIANLVERGVRIGVRDRRPTVDAPVGVLTDADRAELQARHDALVAALTVTGGKNDLDVVAVLVCLRRLGVEVWAVEDRTVPNEHPDIRASGLAVFTRDELELVQGQARRHAPRSSRSKARLSRLGGR